MKPRMNPNLRLKHERTLRGWSQARVAQEIDTSERNIGRWERGFSSPYPYFREKLCQLFGKSAQELGFVEDEEPHMPVPTSDEPVAVSSLYDPSIPPLPNEGRGLVGRQDLLNTLIEQLCLGRNVALRGLPGVGKTALAITLISHPQVLDTFYDGILWAGLGPHPDISRHLSRWGILMGLSSEAVKETSIEEGAMALHSIIGKRHMLLVIDDAWELESALALDVGGPHCSLIVTTRFPRIALRFAHKSVYAVNELSVEDGLALLEQFAPEAMKQESEAIRTLVREVAGLPLSLRLMGRYLQNQAYNGQPRRLLSALTQLRDAKKRIGLIEHPSPLGRPPSLPTGVPVSLQSVIAVSDQQLDEQARLALRSLSVFPVRPNSFSEEAALAVSLATPETLDALCDAGLLEYNNSDRYSLHQTIADYANEHLTEHIAGERLVAYTISHIEQHATDYEILEQESGNILAGLKYAFESGQHLKFVRGVILFTPFLMARGLYDLATLHLQRAYQLTIWSGNTLATATIMLHLGIAAYQQGDSNQSRVYLHEGLTLDQESGNDALADEIQQWLVQSTS